MKYSKPLLISTITTLCLVLMISFAPALVLKQQLHSKMQLFGAEQTEITSLYLNPWSGYFELKGLSATAAGYPDFKIGHLQTEIAYAALWSKRLQITQLQLADVELHLQQADQRWRLGPLLLPLSEPDASSADQPPSQWRGGIDGFSLSNINSSISNAQMSHQSVIEQAVLQQLYQWSPLQQTQLSLQGRLNGSPFALNTQGTPLANQPAINLDLKIESLALGVLTAPWLPGLQGQLSTDLKLQIEQLDNGFSLQQSGSLELDNLDFAQADNRVNSEHISWQGSAQQQFTDGALAQVRSNNQLQIKQFKLQLPQSQLELQEQALQLDGQFEAQGAQQLHFDGTLSSGPSLLQMPDLKLRQQARRWQGKIDIELAESELVRLISDGVLQLQGLQLEGWQLEGLQVERQQANSQQPQPPQLSISEQLIELKGRLDTNTQELSFSGDLQTQPSQIAFEHLSLATQSRTWKGTLGVNLASAAITSLSGDISIGPLQLSHQDGSALLAFEQLQLTQLQAPQPNQIDAASLQLQQLIIGAEQPLLKLDRLDISAISGSPQRTQIGKIHPGELGLRVDLDADLQPFRWNAWLAQLSASPATTETSVQQPLPTATIPEEQASYPFTLGELALQKPAQIQIAEQSKRPYKATIEVLRISDIDSRSEQVSAFAVHAQANRFGNIQLEGDYALFAAAPHGRWQGKISAMELPPFSPLMQGQTGYQIDSGKLKLKTQGSLVAGQVDSSNQLDINNFSVNPASKAAAEKFDGSLGMPLGTAVSLLTDTNDNVALKIPINGKLSDPQFGIQSVLNILIAKATREAAVGYLALTLQPYGALIGLTRLAVDTIGSSAINLEPIYFEPGSATLTAAGIDYLHKIGEMLNERKGLRLKLCGNSVAADMTWLLGQRPAPVISSLPTTSSAAQPALTQTLPLTEQEQETLVQLAEERGFNVKSQLLKLEVNDDQLFSCLTSVDHLNEGRPLVNIGL